MNVNKKKFTNVSVTFKIIFISSSNFHCKTDDIKKNRWTRSRWVPISVSFFFFSWERSPLTTIISPPSTRLLHIFLIIVLFSLYILHLICMHLIINLNEFNLYSDKTLVKYAILIHFGWVPRHGCLFVNHQDQWLQQHHPLQRRSPPDSNSHRQA